MQIIVKFFLKKAGLKIANNPKIDKKCGVKDCE